MTDKINNLCKKCEGKCCKIFEIFLNKKELENLNKFKDKLSIEKEGSGFLMSHEDKCFFKKEKGGCILKEEDKPLDCRLFPLTFIYKNNKLKFYLIKDCIYLNELEPVWIEKTKKWAIKELENWTEEDKITFSKIIEDNSLPDLKEV